MNYIQTISVDLASDGSRDYTAISSICSKCRSVLETKLYEPNINGMELTYFKKCPICKIDFGTHLIVEEM